MKNHLWIAAIVSVSVFNVHAQENPFLLQEQFQKIDKDADALINSLKKIYSERKGSKEVDIVVVPSMEEALVSKDDVNDTNVSNDRNITTKEDNVTVDNEILFKKAIEEQSDLVSARVDAEEKRIEKVREEQSKIEEEKQKVQVVKALEKDKISQEEAAAINAVENEESSSEEKNKNKKVELADKEESDLEEIKSEKNNEKDVLDEEEAAAIKAVENEESNSEEKELKDKKHKTVDINATKDALKAMDEADDALLKAMQEVD